MYSRQKQRNEIYEHRTTAATTTAATTLAHTKYLSLSLSIFAFCFIRSFVLSILLSLSFSLSLPIALIHCLSFALFLSLSASAISRISFPPSQHCMLLCFSTRVLHIQRSLGRYIDGFWRRRQRRRRLRIKIIWNEKTPSRMSGQARDIRKRT